MTDRHDPEIVNREREWDEGVTKQLPELLTKLLKSRVYGLGNEREPPPAAYGVYLFSEKTKPRYVGRVGLTERSRRAGKGFSNFQTRLRGHVRPRHNEGTYAYARTVAQFRDSGLSLGSSRKANCENPEFMDAFRMQCERVRNMDFQVVEMDADSNRLAAVFEIYAAFALELDHQTFAVS